MIRVSLVATEGVANGCANAGGVGATEFDIVINKIEAHLRSDENVIDGIELHACSQVAKEVIRTRKVRAREETARHKGLVEAYALAPNSTFNLDCRMLSHRGSKNSIEVVKDGTEGQEPLRDILCGSPENLATNPEMVGQQNIASNRRKDSAANRLREMIAGGVGRWRPDQAAQSESCIQLLCVNSLADQEEHA